MTPRLDPASKEALIAYRLQRASETIAEVDYNARKTCGVTLFSN